MGLYKAGLILNIIFNAIWLIIFFILGPLSFIPGIGLAYHAIWIICFLPPFASSIIALILIGDKTRQRTRAWGIIAGIWGIFTTPFFLGGIFTLIGVGQIYKQTHHVTEPPITFPQQSSSKTPKPPTSQSPYPTDTPRYTPRDVS